MKIEDLRSLAQATPFREFILKTQGHREFTVEKPSRILLPEERPDLVIIFDPLGTLHILDPEHIMVATVR